MVTQAWRQFEAEIARWRDCGRPVEFWWRDDDAARPAPELARLLDLASDTGVPLALAVVPDAAVPETFENLGRGVSLLQHGVDHVNRAEAGGKKTEFSPGEPIDAALARLAAGRARLESLAGARSIAVLAPPWNRLPEALVLRLAGAGLYGLSTYGARASAAPAPGIDQINTHVDIIAWRSGRGFVGEDAALGLAARHLAARRTGAAESAEPTGWLTHHACHDEAAWTFLSRLFETTLGTPGILWRSAADLFSDGSSRP
jgi:hypothetical protein